jgi:hypothetical protein
MAIKKTTTKKSDPPKKKWNPTHTMMTGKGQNTRYRYEEGGQGMGGIKKDANVFYNPATKAPTLSESVRLQRTVKKASPAKSNLLGVKSKKK